MRLPQPNEPWLWQLIASIRDILWPAPDEYEEDAPERQWSSDTVQAVGELMEMDGFGPEREAIANPFACPTCPGGGEMHLGQFALSFMPIARGGELQIIADVDHHELDIDHVATPEFVYCATCRTAWPVPAGWTVRHEDLSQRKNDA